MVYLKSFPTGTDEEKKKAKEAEDNYEDTWKKMDADGDGNLTVKELAKYFGFDFDSNNTMEMTDEQILEALQMQAALEELNDKPKKEEKPPAPAPTGRDTTIKMVNIEKKKENADAAETMCVEFLELCQMKELVKADKTKESVDKMLDEYEAKPFKVRCEDEKAEMALHRSRAVPSSRRRRTPAATRSRSCTSTASSRS